MIASRGSALARWQAEAVASALRTLHPDVAVELHWVTSEGDRVLDRPLSAVGGKGLFTRSVDEVVLSERADLAVHSLKDVPSDLPAGLTLASIPPRGSVRDVLVSASCPGSLSELHVGAIVGTSSPRRAAQLRRAQPGVRVVLLRGNVETRLRRVLDPAVQAADASHLNGHSVSPSPARFDGTILAAAGLQRLKLNQPRWLAISFDEMLPAACQGALGVVCRSADAVTLQRCLPLNDGNSSTAVHAERELVRHLGADCHSPICVLANPVNPAETRAKRNADSHWFRLRARVLSADGRQCIDFDQTCKTPELRRLVAHAADTLTQMGAVRLLAEARTAQLFEPMPLHGSDSLHATRPTRLYPTPG